MKKVRPKIKYLRCKDIYLEYIVKCSEITDKPSEVQNSKNGIYYIFRKVWINLVCYESKWYYYGEGMTDFPIHDFDLLPNLSEKEWDAIKLIGHKRLNKYWKKMLEARLHYDWYRNYKIKQFKSRKKK